LVTSFWKKALNKGLPGLWIISTLGNFPPVAGGIGAGKEGWGRNKGAIKMEKVTIQVRQAEFRR
jgi:hypothetical protein